MDQMIDITRMREALALARRGFLSVAPNPMVGCVIASKSTVYGVGYHKYCGGNHAEIEALTSMESKRIPDDATTYVTLEPCSHQGRTPPCVHSLINRGAKRVVFGSFDPNPLTSGRAIEILRSHQVEVVSGVLDRENKILNKRFFTFFEQKRPYIILKWAQTSDGFIARSDGSSKWISSLASRAVVHSMRAREQAILVGTQTALVDNPQLTTRHVAGANPLRVIIDLQEVIPVSHQMFADKQPTILLTSSSSRIAENVEYCQVVRDDLLKELCEILYKKNILSIIVEGGSRTLQSFIDAQLWDEAYVWSSSKNFVEGLRAPTFHTVPRSKYHLLRSEKIAEDVLNVYHSPDTN